MFVNDEDDVLDIANKFRKPQNKVMWWHPPIKGPWQTSLIFHGGCPPFVFNTEIWAASFKHTWSSFAIPTMGLWTVYMNLMEKKLFPLFSWLYKYHRELLLHFVLLYCGCLGCEPVAAGRAPSFLLRAFWWSFRWGVSDITDAAYLVNSSVPFADCTSGQLFH